MKKCVRKIFFLTAAVMLLTAIFCFSANAAPVDGIYTYEVTNGEAKIMKVSTSAAGEITTPATLGGYPVTAINGFAFDGCTGLTKVTVSDGVKSLGYGTFNGCSNLGNIVLPDSVTTVDYEAVSSAKWYSLQPSGVVYLNGVVIGYKGTMPINSTITLKEGTKAIASGAFKDKTNLVGINFPDGFEVIGTEAFSGCFNIRTITFPKSLKAINSMAFYNSSKLTSVTIPENVTEIGFYAFEGCTALTEVTFDTKNELKDNSGFMNCDNISVVKFGKNAVSYAPTALQSSKIKTFTTDSENTAFTVDADGVLFNKDKTVLIKYPTGNENISYTVQNGVKAIAKEAFKGSSYLSVLNIPSGVETIGDKAFEKCKSLTTVKLESGVKSIGEYAFSNCENLTSVTLPASITYLGKHVFDNASKLDNVVLPEGFKEVPDFTFYGCTSLKSVTIPSTVTRIGWSAFYGCTNLMNTTLPDSITEVSNYAFDNTGWYNSLSNGPAYIGKVLYKFKGQADVNSTVSVNEGTVVIANGAFAYNANILKLIIPSSVKRIGDEAFTSNTNLTYLTLGSSVEYIGNNTFFNCSKLSSLTLPSSLKEIGKEAFKYCTPLSTVSLGKNVEKLGEGAFYNCNIKTFTVDSSNPYFAAVNGVLFNKDKTVLYAYPSANTSASYAVASTVKEIAGGAFYGAENLKSISVPASVEKVGKNAFDFSGWYESLSDGVVYVGSVLYNYKGSPAENSTLSIKSGTVGVTEEALKGMSNIIKITFPDSIKYVGSNSFERTGWYNAQPAGLVYTGKAVYTYKGTTEENSVLDLSDAKAIADGAFKDNANIKEVKLGEGVEVIGKDAFSGCVNLQKLLFENAQCEIYPSAETISPTALIAAVEESTAKEYADKYSRNFESFCAHKNTKTVPALEATCLSTGYTAGVYCEGCKTYISGYEIVPAKGHTAVTLSAKAASCTETGLTEGKKCSVCGTVLVAQSTTPALGHKEETLRGQNATCTETGLTEGKKCTVCGTVTVAQKVVAKKSHSQTLVKGYEATCTSTGLTDGTRCSACGDMVVEQTMIPMEAHSEVAVAGKDATCTVKGLTEGKRCSVCGITTVSQTEIPALGHKEEAVVGKAATCTEAGLTEGKKCTVCGVITVSQTEIPTLGHKEEAVAGKNATCTETGLTEGKKCSVCGKVTKAQKEISALGHKEVAIPAKKATYKATGLTEGKKCSVCGKVTVKQKKVSRKKLSKVKSLKVKSTTTTTVKLSWKKVTGAESYKVYYSTNGKKWTSVKVTKNSATIKKLKAGTAYSFKVKAFAGKYYGSVSDVVKTATKVTKAKISSVKSSKKAQATVNWKTVSGADGYVVEYSTSKKFTKKTTKTATVKKGSSKKTTLKKLKSGKKYYVRVKAYKVVNGKKVYGAYSDVKTVKVK